MGTIASLRTLALGLVLLPGASGCVQEEEVYAMRALVVTGGEGTDGNVDLCWTIHGRDECHDLSSKANDFESGMRQTFDVEPEHRWSVTEKPDAVWLTYSAGLSIGDRWQVAEITVTAFGTDDSQTTLCRVEPEGFVSSKIPCL